MNLKILTTLGCSGILFEFKDIDDPRLFWDLIKYKIRQDTISYSKFKARERKAKLADLQVKCDQDPSLENVNKLEILKTEYDLQYEYLAQGAIIRSRARWYEQGEKSNKYFLNLESSRGKKKVQFERFLERISL